MVLRPLGYLLERSPSCELRVQMSKLYIKGQKDCTFNVIASQRDVAAAKGNERVHPSAEDALA